MVDPFLVDSVREEEVDERDDNSAVDPLGSVLDSFVFGAVWVVEIPSVTECDVICGVETFLVDETTRADVSVVEELLVIVAVEDVLECPEPAVTVVVLPATGFCVTDIVAVVILDGILVIEVVPFVDISVGEISVVDVVAFGEISVVDVVAFGEISVVNVVAFGEISVVDVVAFCEISVVDVVAFGEISVVDLVLMDSKRIVDNVKLWVIDELCKATSAVVNKSRGGTVVLEDKMSEADVLCAMTSVASVDALCGVTSVVVDDEFCEVSPFSVVDELCSLTLVAIGEVCGITYCVVDNAFNGATVVDIRLDINSREPEPLRSSWYVLLFDARVAAVDVLAMSVFVDCVDVPDKWHITENKGKEDLE